MKLVLSHYLKTLRERDEFDRLLPELLFEMGYVSLAKPQTGPRQYGVDFAAAGKSSDDGVDELLLFVLKQGDIGRQEWDVGTNAVRPSLVEVIDVYLRKHVPPEYQSFRKVIILSTTGELKQDTQLNWTGFIEQYTDRASFRFWGGNKVAELLEKYLLNENLFDTQDRSDLRKSLALAADPDYRFQDLCRLLLRQLGLTDTGELSEQGRQQDTKALQKALRRVNLAARICAYWADAEGERRQALWVSERTILWTWHRIQLHPAEYQAALYADAAESWRSYLNTANHYYEAILDHVNIRDGLSGYCRESGEFSIVLFEHIGLLATIGIAQALSFGNDEGKKLADANAAIVAEAVRALIDNHDASGSPRLDGHAIDICLALFLFMLTDKDEPAKAWLQTLAFRLDFTLRSNRLFPVGSDSLDDLVELDVEDDDEFKESLKQTSWMFATIAAWCALLRIDDSYEFLAKSLAEDYPQVGAQLWHPTTNWPARWYFSNAHAENGESEAPYALSASTNEQCKRMAEFLGIERFKWVEHSPAFKAGLWALDFVACRHFRDPVPAVAWYPIVKLNAEAIPLAPSPATPADYEGEPSS